MKVSVSQDGIAIMVSEKEIIEAITEKYVESSVDISSVDIRSETGPDKTDRIYAVIHISTKEGK